MTRRACFFQVVILAAIPLYSAAAQLPPIPEKVDQVETPKPELFLEKPVVDLGEVIEGDRPTANWVLVNRVNADLIIKQTRAGCGCTVVRLKEEEKVIPPGGSRVLKADFHTQGRRGKQTKGITVFTNDPVSPMVKLQLVANIKSLYTIKPSGMANLQSVRRGGTASKTIDILPGDEADFEILSAHVPEDVPLRLLVEPFDADGSKGQPPPSKGWRIRVSVDESASLGTITTELTLGLRIGDIKQERVVPIRCSVVGDLSWTPRVLDITRHLARGGTRLPPLIIRSEEDLAFKILGADAGPPFDISVEQVSAASPGTRYSVVLTVREDAEAGPFGTTLHVRTDSLDEPLIEVPVFGIVAPPVTVEPPMIMLRLDGTEVGMHRRIKLQASPQSVLKIEKIECDLGSVTITVDQQASSRYDHLCFLDARLTDSQQPVDDSHRSTERSRRSADRGLAPGEHEAMVTVMTSLKGARRLEIPIRIEVPERGR